MDRKLPVSHNGLVSQAERPVHDGHPQVQQGLGRESRTECSCWRSGVRPREAGGQKFSEA